MRKKEVQISDNLYCVIDGYIDSLFGEYPKLVYIPGMQLAVRFTALSYLMYDFEKMLENEGYHELLIKFRELKNDAEGLIKESEARNDRVE